MRPSRPLAARLATAAFLALGAVALAACGSRTGLFGSDTFSGTSPDGGFLPDGAPIGDAPPDGFVPCMPGTFTFDLATAQLMFVIDRSGSMAFSLNGQQGMLPPGVMSRWDTLRDALFQTITPFDNVLAMGAKFFPEPSAGDPMAPADEACAVDVGVGIAPARGNVAQIINVFDTTTPIGGTPTSEALRLAAQYIAGTRGVARTMILATDGAPNCNDQLDKSTCTCTKATGPCTRPGDESNCLDDQRTIQTITDIFKTMNIPVYVIGIGSTERPEFLQVLDNMAIAGGRPRPTTPRHYNVQSSAELKGALQSIGDSIAKCTYLTPSAPTDPNAITVEINGKIIPRDPTHMNGWDWVDQTFGTLAFFGAACTAASGGTSTMSQVSGVVSCNNP